VKKEKKSNSRRDRGGGGGVSVERAQSKKKDRSIRGHYHDLEGRRRETIAIVCGRDTKGGATCELEGSIVSLKRKGGAGYEDLDERMQADIELRKSHTLTREN